MVNRKDFRPSNRSSSISEKQSETIKKNTTKNKKYSSVKWENDAMNDLSKKQDISINNHKSYDNHIEVDANNERWIIFESYDDAERYAQDRVREDLEDNPEYFNKDFIESHIDTDRLDSQLEDDATESSQNYYDDIESESDRNYDNRLYAELIEGGYLDKDDILDENGDVKENIDQSVIDSAKEDAVNSMTKDKMSRGGLEYLREFYNEEDAIKKAIEIAGIDIDSATKDAVSEDGVAHFISSYDGNEIELKNGGYAYRID